MPARALAPALLAALLLAAAPLAAQQAPRDLPPGLPGGPVAAQATAPTDLVALFTEFYRRHPVGSTVAPSQARVLDAASLPAGLAPPPAGERYVLFDGMIVAIDSQWKLLRIVRRAPAPTTQATAPSPTPSPAPAPAAPAPSASADAQATATATVDVQNLAEALREAEERGAAAARGRTGEAEEDGPRILTIAEAEAQGIRIPRGHQPEPGACRLWFPGRPPGKQPRGGSCDMTVPEGAVLIRG